MKKIMVSFVVLLSVFLLASCGASPSTPTVVPTQHPADTTAPGMPTTQPAPTSPSSSSVPFKVVSIDMGVNPASIAGMTCGQAITVTYTATFHVVAHSSGGTAQFLTTVNNGRSTTPARLNFGPGQTIKSYAFTWQGTLSS